MPRSKRPGFSLFTTMAFITGLAFAVPVPVAADGCEECLPGGECEWYDCDQSGPGCWTCFYRCAGDQTCEWDTCDGITICD